MSEIEYSAVLDPSVLAVVKEELARKEEEISKKEDQQKKHYLYLNELQNMARDLSGYALFYHHTLCVFLESF